MKLLLPLTFVLLLSGFIPQVLFGQSFKTIGYLPTYRFHTIDDIELFRITHLNIAFANPDANGDLQTNNKDITPIVQKAQAAGVEVFIALAGGGAPLNDWAPWIKASARSSFIHGIITYVKHHGLQGVDVDIEWGTVNSDYSGFVLELKDSLTQHGYPMSVALPGTHRYPEISNEALAAFDWVNLMAYDLTGPWPSSSVGPHSPYSFAESSMNFWLNQGLEKERMTMGLPFYGYDFSDPNNVSSVTFSGMVAMDTSYAQLDQVGQIYFNGLPTITEKTKLAIDELGGVMIWELGQDNFGEFSLLKRIHETIEKFSLASNEDRLSHVDLSVYPNPTTDLAQLRIHPPQAIRAVLFSPRQKILLDRQYRSQDQISLDMKQYPAGVYFLSVKNGSFSQTLRIVKW